MGRVWSEIERIGVDVQFSALFCFFQRFWSKNRETFGTLGPAITPRSSFHLARTQRKKYRAVWMISPAMSTFQCPPSPSIILQQTCSTSCAETILDHVPSNPFTVCLKAGSVVFFESRHSRIAYSAEAIGVKTVESRDGDGSVLIKMV